jgi:hypothetical protein
MLSKTMTSLAFATACLTGLATIPAQAQMAGPGGPPPTYSAPQNYQGNPNYQGDMPSSSAGMGGTDVITNGPQGAGPTNWSARQNVIQSQRYDRMLETNRGFRQARMRRECGPITDPELRQQCLSSFGQDEPFMGSSNPHRASRSDSGR